MERILPFNQTIETIDAHPNFSFITHVAAHPLDADKFQHSTFLDEEHTGTDYERYFSVLDVKDSVEAEMEADFTSRTTNSFYRHARSQKHAFADFYAVLRDFKQHILTAHFQADPFAIKSRTAFMERLIFEDMKVYFEGMPGSSPRSWPHKLDDFIQALFKIPVTGFFHQPFKVQSQYYREFESALAEGLTPFKEGKATEADVANLAKMLKADLLVNFLRGSFRRLLKSFNRVGAIAPVLTDEQNESVAVVLSKSLAVLFKSLLLAVRKTTVDFKGYMNRCERVFLVPEYKMYDFNFQDSYTCTTDGVYLYEATTSVSMIHLAKIGTGREGTRAGIVYTHRELLQGNSKLLSLVYLKGKLYLKTAGDEVGKLDVLSPEDLTTIGKVYLNVDKFMKNPHMAQYNKNFRLLTDGASIYTLMIGHAMVKIEKPPAKSKEAAKGKDQTAKDQPPKDPPKADDKPHPAEGEDKSKVEPPKDDDPKKPIFAFLKDKIAEGGKAREQEPPMPEIPSGDAKSPSMFQDFLKAQVRTEDNPQPNPSSSNDGNQSGNPLRPDSFFGGRLIASHSLPVFRQPEGVGQPPATTSSTNDPAPAKSITDKIKEVSDQRERILKLLSSRPEAESNDEQNRVQFEMMRILELERDREMPRMMNRLGPRNPLELERRPPLRFGAPNDTPQGQGSPEPDSNPQMSQPLFWSRATHGLREARLPMDIFSPPMIIRNSTTSSTERDRQDPEALERMSFIMEREREMLRTYRAIADSQRGDRPSPQERTSIFERDSEGRSPFSRPPFSNRFDAFEPVGGPVYLGYDPYADMDDPYQESLGNTIDPSELDEIAQFEMLKRSQNLYRGKGRKCVPEKVPPPKPQTNQASDGEKHLIEYIVVQFNLDKPQVSQDKLVINDPKRDELAQELYDKFSGYFDLAACRAAIDKADMAIQEAGRLLLKESSKKEEKVSLSPVAETLIYQTECQGYDFKQTKQVKPFNVVNRSLLIPTDVHNGLFCISRNMFLKSTGQLFSLNPEDQLTVEPHEIDNPDTFNPVSRFFKEDAPLRLSPSTESIDVLPHSSGAHGPVPATGKPAKEDSKKADTVLRIRTTFITNHSSLPLFSNHPQTLLYHDPYNALFYTVFFEHAPNAHYGFVRQKVSYFCDNSFENLRLRALCKSPESMEAEALSILSLLGRTKTLAQFGQLLLQVLLTANKSRSEMPQRLNDWVYLLNLEARHNQEKGKKSKSNFAAKIRKIVELSKSRNPEINILTPAISRTFKTTQFRELHYVHFLCAKGDFGTFRLLFDMFFADQANPVIQVYALAFLNIAIQYLESSYSVAQLEEFLEYLLEQLRGRKPEGSDVLSLVARFVGVFAQQQAAFDRFFNFALRENKNLLFLVLAEVFGQHWVIQNRTPTRLSIILSCNAEYDVDDKADKVLEYSLTSVLRRRVAETFFDGAEFTPVFHELAAEYPAATPERSALLLSSLGKIIGLAYGSVASQTVKAEGDQDKNGAKSAPKPDTKEPNQEESPTAEAPINSQSKKDTPIERVKEAALAFLSDFLTKTESTAKSASPADAECVARIRALESLFVFLAFGFRPRDITLHTKLVARMTKLATQKLDLRRPHLKLENNDINSLDFGIANEGLLQSEVYILETTHPIERGKTVTFKRIHNPLAIGFVVEFDRRCQNEEAGDNLTFTSWFEPERKSTQNQGGEGNINKFLAVSARRSLKRQAVFIGDSLDVHFQSSNLAKNNLKSLSQWGYRLYVRPIIGRLTPVSPRNESGTAAENLAMEMAFLEDVGLARNAMYVARSLLESLMKGTSISKPERVYSNYLSWSILQKGLANLDWKTFLTQSRDGEYSLSTSPLDKQQSLALASEGSEAQSLTSKTGNDRLSFVNEDGDVQELLRNTKEQGSELSTLIQHVKDLTPIPFTYANEKRRAQFEKDIQNAWDDLENMIVLCFLHHSNILGLFASDRLVDLDVLTSQPNIKAELEAISKKRYEVISFLMSECKVEQSYQTVVYEIFEWLREEYARKFIAPKVEARRQELASKVEPDKPPEVVDKKEALRRKCLEAQKRGKNAKPALKKLKEGRLDQSGVQSSKDPESMRASIESIRADTFDFFVLAEVDELLRDAAWADKARAIATEAFESKTDDLRRVFLKKDIEFTKEPKENMRVLVEHILKDMRGVVEKSARSGRAEMSLKLENPYQKVADIMRSRLVFLLRINASVSQKQVKSQELDGLNLRRERSRQEVSSRAIQLDPDADLKPLPANRAMTSEAPKSSGLNPQAKSNSIRDSMDYYKNWKDQKSAKADDLTSPDCSPVHSVTKFLTITQPLRIELFQSIIWNASRRIALRIVSFQHYKRLVQAIDGTACEQFMGPFLAGSFSNLSVFENVQTTGQTFKQVLSTLAFDSAKLLIKRFLNLMALVRSVDVEQLYRHRKLMDAASSGAMTFFHDAQTNLDQTFQLLQEVYVLINNDMFVQTVRQAVQTDSLASDSRLKILVQFVPAVCEFLLLCSSLKNLSFDFKYITTAVRRNVRLAALILNLFINAFGSSFFLIDNLAALLRLELGETGRSNQINVSILSRLCDPIGEQRLLFLLKNLLKALNRYHSAEKRREGDGDLGPKCLADSLLIVVLHSRHSRLVKLSLQCLELLNADFNVLKYFAKDDLYQQIGFFDVEFDRVTKRDYARLAGLNPQTNMFQQRAKEQPYVFPRTITSVPSSNLMNVLYKMGDMVLPPSRPKSDAPSRQDTYQVYLHLTNEEDLCPLVRAFYYWETVNPLFSKKYPRTWPDFLDFFKRVNGKQEAPDQTAKKATKNIDMNVQVHQQLNPKMRLCENLIQDIPDVNFVSGDLPIGWFLNSTKIFQNMKVASGPKPSIYQKTTRKTWENKNLTRLLMTLVECLKMMRLPTFETVETVKEVQQPETRPARGESTSSIDLNALFEGGEGQTSRKASISPDRPVEAPKPAEPIQPAESPKPADPAPPADPNAPAPVPAPEAPKPADPPKNSEPPKPAEPPKKIDGAATLNPSEEQIIERIARAQINLEKLVSLEKMERQGIERALEKRAMEAQERLSGRGTSGDKPKDPPKEETAPVVNLPPEAQVEPHPKPPAGEPPKGDESPAPVSGEPPKDPPKDNQPPKDDPPKEPLRSIIPDTLLARLPEVLLTQSGLRPKIIELEETIQKSIKAVEEPLAKRASSLSDADRKALIEARIRHHRSLILKNEGPNPQPSSAEPKGQPLTGKVYRNVSPEDQARIQQDFMKAYILILTLVEICKSIQNMASHLNYTGYSHVLVQGAVYEERRERVEELAYLINMLQQKKMKEIPLRVLNDDIINKKLLPAIKPVNDNNFSLDLSLSIVQSSLIPKLSKFMKYSARLKVPSEDYPKFANKYMVVSEHSPTSRSKTLILNMLAEFVNSLAAKDRKTKEGLTKMFSRLFDGEALSADPPQDDRLKVGLMALTKEWVGELSASQNVVAAVGDQQFKVLAPPNVTGRTNTLAINEAEPRGVIKLEPSQHILTKSVHFDLAILDFDHKKIAERLVAMLKTVAELRMESLTASLSGLGLSLAQQILTASTFRLFLRLLESDKSLSTPEMRDHLKVDNLCSISNLEAISRDFAVAVERVCDSHNNMPILTFEHFKARHERFPFEVERRKVSAHTEEVLATRQTDTNPVTYFPPKSTLLSDLDIRNERVSEFKMLKHWEKHIIPKIHNFVKGSLQPYEIEDFFEQIRIELRKENNPGASNIAYILCDQKLPGDCVLPQLNYDWNCLDLDEIKVGQYVSVKIKDDRFLHSHVFDRYHNLGVNHVAGVVVFKDPINSCVNVLVRDYYQTNLFSVWVPQQAIRPIEVSLQAPPQFYPTDELLATAQDMFDKLIKSMKSEYFIKEFVKDDYKLSGEADLGMLRLIAKRELRGHCLQEWLAADDSPAANPTRQHILSTLLTKVLSQGMSDQVLNQVEGEAANLLSFFARNNYSFNMTTKLDVNQHIKERAAVGSHRVSNLNVFDCADEVAGLIVEFKAAANLYKCSGVKFYNDPEGINLIEHVHSTQRSELKVLYPLVFNRRDVFYQFYYNSEALPAYMKSQSTTKLDCTVFAVPSTLNYVFWVVDALSAQALATGNFGVLARTYKIASNLFVKFKGSNIIRQSIFKLMTRVILRVRSSLKRPASQTSPTSSSNLPAETGPNPKELLADTVLAHPIDVVQLVKNFEFFTEGDQKELFSSFVQDLTEFLVLYSSISPVIEGLGAKYQSKTGSFNVQNKILQEIKQLFALGDFLAKAGNPGHPAGGSLTGLEAISRGHDDKTRREVWDILRDRLDARLYFDHIIIVNNIPPLSYKVVEKLLLETIASERMKVLVPSIDLYIPRDSDDNSVGYVIILYDSWEFKDELPKEPKTEEEKSPEPALPRIWICDICTLENDDSSNVCNVCESPKPENPRYKGDGEEPADEPKEDEEEQVNPWSNSAKADKFIEELLKAFERVTPDKRINCKRFDRHRQGDLEASNEVVEFLMCRMTTDQLSAKLEPTCQMLFSRFGPIIKARHGVDSADALRDYLFNMGSVEFFAELASYGVDLWLEKSCLDHHYADPMQLVSAKDMEKLIEFVGQEVCDDGEYAIHFSGIDFRLEWKAPMKDLDIFAPQAADQLSFKESKLTLFKHMKLNSYTNFAMRLTLTAVQAFNQLLTRHYKLLDLSNVGLASIQQAPLSQAQMPAAGSMQVLPESQSAQLPSHGYLSLGSLISSIRHLWLSAVKNRICESILQYTACARDHTPKVSIERLTKEKEIITEKRGESKRQPKKEQDDRHFNLIQAFKQTSDISPSLLRPQKPKGAEPFICFEIVFKGEHVMGEGGPYRQFFSDISSELQPMYTPGLDSADTKVLSLFIPSPNRLNDTGDFKEKFVVNPSKRSSYYLQLYEFVGLLMGCAFRTGVYLSLNLSTMFWKKMVGQPLTEDDLLEIDIGAVKLLDYFRNLTDEDPDDIVFQNFTVLLSDTSVCELTPDGKNTQVTPQNKELFVQRVLEARFREADPQIAAVRAGFIKIVPEILLNCLSARDLELRVCGRTTINFDLLKKHTRYSGGLAEDSPLIQNFWKALYSFSNADKQRFIKFCWGQERLPSTSQEFENAHIRFMVKPSLYNGPQDGLLPRADTCFFNFELPKYSTLEIMKEKILLAIHTDSDSMNAEENRSEDNNNPDDKSWVSHSQGSEDGEEYMD
jgi:hypothetical protein